jgi:hypothetical protein
MTPNKKMFRKTNETPSLFMKITTFLCIFMVLFIPPPRRGAIWLPISQHLLVNLEKTSFPQKVKNGIQVEIGEV